MGTTQASSQQLTGALCSRLENVATPSEIEPLRNYATRTDHRSTHNFRFSEFKCLTIIAEWVISTDFRTPPLL